MYKSGIKGVTQSQVELPRFGLSFLATADVPKKLESVQYPGWYVDPDQKLAVLGSCDSLYCLTKFKRGA